MKPEKLLEILSIREKFLPLENYEQEYLISESGIIIGLIQNWTGDCPCIRKNFIDKWGYATISLRKKGKRKNYLVHRLVAETFIGPSNGLTVNHIECNKTNNHFLNLEYMTNSQNIKLAYKNGLMNPGRHKKQPSFQTVFA